VPAPLKEFFDMKFFQIALTLSCLWAAIANADEPVNADIAATAFQVNSVMLRFETARSSQ
jgi:hypothetical protein